MKNAKKWMALSLTVVMCLGTWLTGCGSSEKPADTKTEAPADNAAADDTAKDDAAADKPAESSADAIKIGVFEPVTGANAGGGALEVEGFELAHKQRSTVLGRQVDLIIADNKSDKVEAATAASRLVEQEKVVAILGSWGSSLSIAAGDIVRNAEIPAIGASCTNPLVTQGNDYYFRVCFIDPYQGKVMATYAAKELGAKTAAIITEKSNDYSVGLSKFFEDSFIALTGNPDAIVARAEYQTNDSDFNAQITNISSANADVIFAPGNFTESALLIKQARELGIKTPFLGCDTWETPEFISVGGKAVEDSVVFSTFFDSNANLTPKTSEFVELYKANYNGKEPAAVTALAFDAYNLLLDTIEKVGDTNGPKLRDALEATDKFEGATGYVTFDADHNATKAAVIKNVKDANFNFVANVAAE